MEVFRRTAVTSNMKKSYFLIIYLFFTFLNVYSQEDEYIKVSEMKGIPSSLKQLANYETLKEYFTYFNIDEKSYKYLFYKNFIKEKNNNSGFIKLNLIAPKKIVIKPKSFPNYKFILNPKLEKGYLSKHRLSINIREDAITSSFTTNHIEIVFPKSILQSKDSIESTIFLDIKTGIEHNNNGFLNTNVGIDIKGIKDFNIVSSFIPNSFIDLIKTKKAELKFINKGKSDITFFEDNRLYDFVNSYQKRNGKYRMKKINEYKSAILLKNVSGLINLEKTIDYKNAEIYFFKNFIAGVLKFQTKKKKKLLIGVNNTFNVINMSDLSLKENGDFPTFYNNYKNTYFKTEQDFENIRMYFIIIK